MAYTTLIHTSELSADRRQRLQQIVPGALEKRAGYCLLRHPEPGQPGHLAALRNEWGCDINTLPEAFEPGAVRLLVTDMDSTFIAIECIDEIADMLGIKPQVAEITAAAMEGKLDFPTALRRRVALLQGLPVDALQRVYDQRLRLNPGAETLLAQLRARGIRIALVSGGFTFFTERLRERLGLDYTLANTLEIHQGRLTGEVSGAIVDADAKAALVDSLCRDLQIDRRQCLAMGDGANDLKMLARAGLAIAYHAKPLVQEAAAVVFNHCTLEGVCHVLQA